MEVVSWVHECVLNGVLVWIRWHREVVQRVQGCGKIDIGRSVEVIQRLYSGCWKVIQQVWRGGLGCIYIFQYFDGHCLMLVWKLSRGYREVVQRVQGCGIVDIGRCVEVIQRLYSGYWKVVNRVWRGGLGCIYIVQYFYGDCLMGVQYRMCGHSLVNVWRWSNGFCMWSRGYVEVVQMVQLSGQGRVYILQCLHGGDLMGVWRWYRGYGEVMQRICASDLVGVRRWQSGCGQVIQWVSEGGVLGCINVVQ